MAQATPAFRIFVSSSFGDLEAERSVLREGWLGTVIDCPKDGCRGRLRVNPFTVGPSQRA